MELTCPHCNESVTIAEPGAPTPNAAIVIKCSHCEESFVADNPMGDDMFIVGDDGYFPPGEKYLPAGSRITFAQATSYGLLEPTDGTEPSNEGDEG